MVQFLSINFFCWVFQKFPFFLCDLVLRIEYKTSGLKMEAPHLQNVGTHVPRYTVSHLTESKLQQNDTQDSQPLG